MLLHAMLHLRLLPERYFGLWWGQCFLCLEMECTLLLDMDGDVLYLRGQVCC